MTALNDIQPHPAYAVEVKQKDTSLSDWQLVITTAAVTDEEVALRESGKMTVPLYPLHLPPQDESGVVSFDYNEIKWHPEVEWQDESGEQECGVWRVPCELGSNSYKNLWRSLMERSSKQHSAK